MNFACQTSWKHWISVLLENFVSIESSWTLFYLILFKCSFMEIGQWETAFVSLSAFSCTSFILCVRMITQSSYDKFKAFSQACCFIYSQEGVQKPAKRVLPSPSPHTQPNKSPRPGEYCTGKCKKQKLVFSIAAFSSYICIHLMV